jgi:hypothetical protein
MDFCNLTRLFFEQFGNRLSYFEIALIKEAKNLADKKTLCRHL